MINFRSSRSGNAGTAVRRRPRAGCSCRPTGGVNLSDYGARMYNPRLERWLSVDPKAEEFFDRTFYGYCSSDPVNRIDPMG